MEIGPVKVEFAGVAQSTWNLQRFKGLDAAAIFIT